MIKLRFFNKHIEVQLDLRKNAPHVTLVDHLTVGMYSYWQKTDLNLHNLKEYFSNLKWKFAETIPI